MKPIDDTDYKALSGRPYCFGGPTIVMSRPLLKGAPSDIFQMAFSKSDVPGIY